MLILGRQVGQSLRVGDFRLILRGRNPKDAEITLVYGHRVRIMTVAYTLAFKLGKSITITPYPHRGNEFINERAMNQVNFHIRAPRDVPVIRDEIEATRTAQEH
ncbi:hypothetical protein KCM76_23385 [Zooshikella marina]|uniref:hypothetical protein n=1 Tax=Zooshikella ganghwensis TaxID=202772 RepID=UPI001BAF2376|nr:hypothetical protein [Zooshikella ganghwensis]MBU2708958.1 hypothetical protein [Zooshikella ganghwensis]